MEVNQTTAQQTAVQDLSHKHRYCVSPKLRWFNDKFGAIVYHTKTKRVHVLNSHATLLALLCDGNTSLKTAISSAKYISGHSKPGKAETTDLVSSYTSWLTQAKKDRLIVNGKKSKAYPKPMGYKRLKKVADGLLKRGEFATAKRCALVLLEQSPEKADFRHLLADCDHGLETTTTTLQLNARTQD